MSWRLRSDGDGSASLCTRSSWERRREAGARDGCGGRVARPGRPRDDTGVTDAAAAMRSSSDTTEGLSVLVADEDTEALRSTARVLGTLGHTVAAYAVSVNEASERISEEDPDLSVVAVHDDLEHALDLID